MKFFTVILSILFASIPALADRAPGPTTFAESQGIAESAALARAYNDGVFGCAVNFTTEFSTSRLNRYWLVTLSCESGSASYEVQMENRYFDDDGGPNATFYFSVGRVERTES